MAPYQLNKKELLELKNNLNDMLLRGYIKPNKSMYVDPLIFVDQ